MNNAFIKLIALFSVITIVSCSSQNKNSANIVENPAYGAWQDLEQSPLKFELEQTFGNNRDIMFPSVWRLQGPVADRAGNIYVIDGENGVMYSFAPNGDLRWKKGKEGKGPGDFERPRGLVINDGFLYTANVSGSRIDQFDLEGNLVNSTTVESLGLSFAEAKGFISDSLLVTSSTLWGKVGRIVTILNLADSLKKFTQFEVVAPIVDFGEGLGYSLDVAVNDSLIAVGGVGNYILRFYNIYGENVKTITRDFEKLMRPGFFNSETSRSIRGYGSLKAPIQLKSDYYLAILNWPTNVDDPDQFLKKSRNNKDAPEVIYANSLDLYKADGMLLYSLEQEGSFPGIGNISYIDAQGNVYTKSNEPFTQIRRYNLTITSPRETEMTKETVELDV